MQNILFGVAFDPKGRLNKAGKGKVFIRAYQDRAKLYLYTGVEVKPESWDKKRQRVKMTSPNAIEQNKLITALLEKLEGYALEQACKGRAVSLDNLREYASPKQSFTDFIQYFDSYLKRTRSLKPNTLKSYKSVLKHLRAFRKRIEFEDLTYRTIQELDIFLRDRVGVNTAGKYLKQIRAVINQGIKEEVIPPNIAPFRAFRIKAEATPPKYIYSKEVEAIEGLNLENEKPALQYARDMYLFATYTALRISDTKRITPKDIHELEGEKWLIVDKMTKTSESVKLPITKLFNGKPLELLSKYDKGADIPYFGAYSDQYINRLLKELAELAGIGKKLTFHTARHTSATYLLNKGVPLDVVQKVLGHTKQSTTEIYAKVLGSTIKNEIAKAFSSQ